jgi:threonine aldolase
MANLINAMIMAPLKGDSIIIGDLSHIAHYERGSISAFGGIFPTVMPNAVDGTLDVKSMNAIIPTFDDPHIAAIKGISIETPIAHLGGRVLRHDYIKQVRAVADHHNVMLHIDGARSWNAAVASNLDMKTYL